MEVLFRGRLSYELRVSHVLERVRDLKTKGVTLLFLRSSDHAIEGVVSIWNARFITSAYCYRSTLSGYPAIKQLFTLATADFAYGKAMQDEVTGIEHGLNMELKNIIPILPFLPENLSELFDQDSLLDKVFAAKVEPSTPSQLQVPSINLPSQVKKEHQIWQLFKSLITVKKSPKAKSRVLREDAGTDLRITQRITQQRIRKRGRFFAISAGLLKFWARTEFLVLATALITALGLLWFWEEIGPSLSKHFKESSPLRSDWKSLLRLGTPKKG